MIAEWSAAVAAAAFVILTAGVLIAARIMLIRLSRMEAAALQLQQELKQLTLQAGRVMVPAEQAIQTVNRQLNSVSGIFDAAAQIGGAVSHTTSAVEQLTSVMASAAEQHAKRPETMKKAGDILEWAELGMAAWTLWQSGRRQETADSSSEKKEPI